MLSLIRKRRKRQKRAKPGTGLKVQLQRQVEKQIQRGVPRQAIYNELMRKSRAVLVDDSASTPHSDANAYMSAADEVLHVMMDRCHRAEKCEGKAQIAQAIQLYEANVTDGFEGVRPYERLRLIYTRQGRYEDAVRICQTYLSLPDREHGRNKDDFRQHLQKLQAKTASHGASSIHKESQRKGSKMEPVKIMPCLDMKDGRVVKGIHFVNLRDAGDPVENAAFYEKEGADELAMLDIAATVENRKTRLEWVKSVSAVITIPLTVGGGIASLEDIGLVLDAGASKVSMNSAAVRNPELVRQAAAEFGSDKITVAIDARRNAEMPSGFELVISGGTKPVGQDAIAWAKQCQDLGAGVLLPTSMDGDGTLDGYDLEFTRAISDAADLPVVASGGAGKLEHFYEAVVQGGAQTLLAASVFHFRTLSIGQVKEYLQQKGIPVYL